MLPGPPAASLATAFVIASFNPLSRLPDATLCSEFYYGSVGTHSFFWLPSGGSPCSQALLAQDPGFFARHPVIHVEKTGLDLFWLERAVVGEEYVRSEDGLTEYLDRLRAPASPTTMEGQQPLYPIRMDPVKVIMKNSGSALLHVDTRRIRPLEITLPTLWKGSLLSTSPVPFVPVPPLAVKRVREILGKVKFDPWIASIVNNISIPQMRNDIRFLTGEDEKSGIESRHSFSDGILVAAEWIRDRMSDTGADCKLEPFSPGFGPNVICSYPSVINTTETVLLSAHYDSRGSFGSTRAPGADDDGSGTVSILAIARTIARRKVNFKANVQLCLFAGEEQGLVGSRAYAKELQEKGANLTLMVQADMLAYRAPGEPPQLGLPDLIGTPEVTQLVANVSAIYSPELTVGFTPACCSDHQSFHEQGFPATQVFERAGPIADPMYHNSGDLSDREGYDFAQLRSIAKVQFATLLHSAGYTILNDDA